MDREILEHPCFEVTSGVPAGTHGRPDLFLIIIDDLVDCLKNTESLFYADDGKFIRVIKNETDYALLQDDVKNFQEWCDVNKLSVNVEKCLSTTSRHLNLQHSAFINFLMKG